MKLTEMKRKTGLQGGKDGEKQDNNREIVYSHNGKNMRGESETNNVPLYSFLFKQ